MWATVWLLSYVHSVTHCFRLIKRLPSYAKAHSEAWLRHSMCRSFLIRSVGSSRWRVLDGEWGG